LKRPIISVMPQLCHRWIINPRHADATRIDRLTVSLIRLMAIAVGDYSGKTDRESRGPDGPTRPYDSALRAQKADARAA
jgi:hypothetical protein